ncbi:hypothetical protein DFJ73DRAFT_756215 [Zopfochytrium polystomum]|nr:hypothetical protein DFJ73DRAFT_756215 [Zopfochytrium polystomum]
MLKKLIHSKLEGLDNLQKVCSRNSVAACQAIFAAAEKVHSSLVRFMGDCETTLKHQKVAAGGQDTEKAFLPKQEVGRICWQKDSRNLRAVVKQSFASLSHAEFPEALPSAVPTTTLEQAGPSVAVNARSLWIAMAMLLGTSL